MRLKECIAFLVGLVLLVLGSACAGGRARPPDAGPGAPSAVDEARSVADVARYRIGLGDELEIAFPYRTEFSVQAKVRPDGRVSAPFVGAVLAAGKTPEALAAELRALYGTAGQLYEVVAGDTVHSISKRFGVPVETLIESNGLGRGATIFVGQKLFVPSSAGARVLAKEYRIAVGDRIEVKFPNHPELTDTLVVRPDGRISLALINSVVAEGKTPEILTDELRRSFATFLETPNPVVIVREFTTQRYYVDGVPIMAHSQDLSEVEVRVVSATPMQIYVGGEVVRGGFQTYQGRITALQAILASGGRKPTGDLGRVTILRRYEDGPGRVMVQDLRARRVAGDAGGVYGALENDVALQPYDVVLVPKTTIANVNEVLDQYLYTLIPALGNSSFGFVYNIGPDVKVR